MAAVEPAGPPPTTSTSNGSSDAEPLGVALGRALVELRDDLVEGHPALAEQLAVAEDHRHGEHAALLDLVGEHRAVDGDVADAAG